MRKNLHNIVLLKAFQHMGCQDICRLDCIKMYLYIFFSAFNFKTKSAFGIILLMILTKLEHAQCSFLADGYVKIVSETKLLHCL